MKKQKKALFIIASRDFRDEEYFIPRDFLEDAGIHTSVTSNKSGVAVGVYGNDVDVELKIEEVNFLEYSAVIFVGGIGALKYLDNERFYKVVRDVMASNILLAAICIAPLILANAGVLTSKKATVWSSLEDRKTIRMLEEKGAIYSNEGVVCDGNIITADGPAQATAFAEKIVEKM